MSRYNFIESVTFSDTDKQIIGSIFAALLGALIGALAGAWISSRSSKLERSAQQDYTELRRRRDVYLKNSDAIVKAQYALQGLIMNAANNEMIFNDYSPGIFVEGNEANSRFQINSPKQYVTDTQLGWSFYNNEIQVYWQNLMQEIDLQNTIVNEFNEYYKELRTQVHVLLIKGESIDRRVIESDNETILEAVGSAKKATEVLRQKCLKLYAMIEAFAEWYTKNNTRTFTTSLEFRDLLDEMHVYIPKETALTKRIAKLEERFDRDSMFKVS